MAERQLTSEQRRAVEVAGPAAIRAGAGSGKTAVLASHFLHLLRPDGADPPLAVGQLLAITFTDKAASEMTARIRSLLAAEIAQASGTALRHWERVRRELLAAQISTIHTFCARIVRENPIEAAIDPRAEVLDEHEGRVYVETVVEQELTRRLTAGDPTARALLMRCRRLRGQRGAVEMVARLLGRLATLGRDAAWLRSATDAQAALAPVAMERIAAAAGRVRAQVEAAIAAGGKKRIAKLADGWPAFAPLLERIATAPAPDDVQALTALAGLLSGGGLKQDAAADLTLDGGRPRGVIPEELAFLLALPESRDLAALVGEVSEVVAARKRADAVLTFDDLITQARTLLASQPSVLARYARRFRAVLVDEFQDTDVVQAEVVRLLARDGAALFVVGDEKQSIYRFRGADVAVFQEVRAALPAQLTLGTNFRSQPDVLAFVNALAATTFRTPSGGDPRWWTAFEPADHLIADRPQTWPEAGVRLVSFIERYPAGDRIKVATARVEEARVLAEVIARLRADHDVRYGEIAVLFRVLNQVKAYEYALRARQIPYYVVKGRGFFQCQEVRDVASLLAAVADPDDGIALAATLRSPFFALDDHTLATLAWPPDRDAPRLARRFRARDTFADVPADAERLGRIRDLLHRLRQLRSRATVAELIEEALAATDFEAVCLTQFQGAQKVANVRKLIELARSLERRRLLTLRDFVRIVRELAERQPREAEAPLVGEQDDVVRLMTVHQAKGLEFRVVVLVDLGRQMESEKDAIVVDDALGVVAAPVQGAGGFPLHHARLAEYRDRERDRGRAELARLLYVACTRAKDHLVLLEGKGDARHLRAGGGDPFVWCHQVWETLGREAVAAFVDGGAPSAILPVPGGRVRVERAADYLRAAAAPPPVPEPTGAPATDDDRALVAHVVQFRPPAPREVVTSPTALADFRRCPRQYWYRHVVAFPESGGGGRRARLIGTAAHGVLEGLDLGAASDADLADELRARPEALLLAPRDLDGLVRDLHAAATALRADVAGGLEVVGREVPFVLALPQAAPRVLLEGRIDLLGRRGDAAVVRDYKYATPSAASEAQHGAQLGAYRLAVHAAGATRVDAELVFLRGGTAVRPLAPLDAAAEEAALARAGAALGAALADGRPDAFPRRPPDAGACAALGCGYVRRCWAGVTTGRAASPATDSVAS